MSNTTNNNDELAADLEINATQLPTQDLPADDGVESFPVGENPAQKMDHSATRKASKSSEAASLDITTIVTDLQKIVIEIAESMNNCNDIETVIKPIIKDGQYITENLEKQIVTLGQKALIYKMAGTISKAGGAFHTADGNIKNVKFALARIQRTIDDIIKKFPEKTDEQ